MSTLDQRIAIEMDAERRRDLVNLSLRLAVTDAWIARLTASRGQLCEQMQRLAVTHRREPDEDQRPHVDVFG